MLVMFGRVLNYYESALYAVHIIKQSTVRLPVSISSSGQWVCCWGLATGSRYRSTAAVAAWRAVIINFGTTLRRFDVFVASWSATVVSPVAWFLVSVKGHLYIFLQVARRIYKGIPEKMRGLVWSLLLGIEQEAKKNVGVYEVSYLMRDNYMHMYVYNKHSLFYTHGYFSTSRIYTVSQKKTRHLTLAHNFTRYWLIFKILSLLDSVGNL